MQLTINFDPILETHSVSYNGFIITATKREKQLRLYDGASKRYQQRYNMMRVCYRVNNYWQTNIKGKGQNHDVCGEYSDCFSLEIAIECTKKYIDHHYS